jgi:hypothetical protein
MKPQAQEHQKNNFSIVSKTKLFLLLLFVGMTISCSSGDDDQPWVNNPPQNTEIQFTGKWWYSHTSSGGDLYFDSNGTHQVRFGTDITTYDWEWVDEGNMIFSASNSNNVFYGKVTTLDADNMSLKISFNNGVTYDTTVYDFTDTQD